VIIDENDFILKMVVMIRMILKMMIDDKGDVCNCCYQSKVIFLQQLLFMIYDCKSLQLYGR